jgi:hypothetical protein
MKGNYKIYALAGLKPTPEHPYRLNMSFGGKERRARYFG